MLAGYSDQATLGPLRAMFSGGFQLLAPDGTEIAASGKRTPALPAVLRPGPGVAVDREQPSKLPWRGKFRAHAQASLRRLGQRWFSTVTPLELDLTQPSQTRRNTP